MKKITALLTALICLFITSSCKWNTETGDNIQHLKHGELIIEGGESGISIPVYDFDTFQPLATKSKIVTEDMQIVYEPLFSFDTHFNVVPTLASGYVISADGLNITVSLKNDVTWHDGSMFTAYDVAYTVYCMKNAQTLYSAEAENIVSCDAVSANTCVFTMKKPVPNVLGILTFPIIKDATPMNAGSDYIPVGTGPYCYGEKKGASRVMFTVNEKWHGGQAKIKNIEIKILKDKESAVYAFEASEVQCISSESLNLGRYTPKGHVEATDYISNRLTFLGMNFYKSVLWGENTRQAIGYLVDKTEIVNGDVYGRAAAVDIPLNPAAWCSPQDLLMTHDTTKAEELLALDGWIRDDSGKYMRNFNGGIQPFTLELLTNIDSDEKLSIANRIATQLNDAGLSITVKALPYADYVKQIENKAFDLFVGEIQIPGSMDPSKLVGSEGNYFTYVNTQMDELIAKMGRTQETETQKQLWLDMRTLFLKDMPFVPLFYRNGWVVRDERIRGEIEPTCYRTYNKVGSWYIYQR